MYLFRWIQRVPFSRTFLWDASYSYFSKYWEEIIEQWKNNSDAFFADSTWALLTVLDDTTMKSLSKEDMAWLPLAKSLCRHDMDGQH